MKKKIVVIGSSNIDMIMKTDRLPTVGETVGGGVFTRVNGGKGANQAVGAARAGGNVYFVSCLGQDIFADNMINNFELDEIRTDFVFKEKGLQTGVALIMVNDEGENLISVAPGANYCMSPAHIDRIRPLLEEAEMIALQLEIPYETTKYIINLAHELGVKVMLNPAPARKMGKSLLEKLHLLVLNQGEAALFSGLTLDSREKVKQAADKLLDLGVKIAIITMGERGSYLASRSIKQFVNAYEVEVVDSTAAGNVFCGSLAVALAEGKTILDAVQFATAAAALSVTKLGAQPSIPLRHEIIDFMENNSNC